MDEEDKQLAARLASLQGLSSDLGDHGNRTALQERLNALSGGSVPAEEDLNSRLASLSAERDKKSSSAENLNNRLSLLAGTSSRKSVTATPRTQQYDVPEDCSDEWQDLDDLLETALEEGASGTLAFNGKASLTGEPDVDNKLSELDALLAAEDTRAALGSSALDGGASVEHAADDSVEQAVEAFLGAAGPAGRRDEDCTRGRNNEEEERLLQMVSDQVRLEGHGLVSTPVQQPPGEMWLPVAPTGRPEISPSTAAFGGRTPHQPPSGTSTDTNSSARLIAQQAMDEARLDLDGTVNETTALSKRGDRVAPGGRVQPAAREEDQAPGQGQRCEKQSSSWCCICSEDASVRCGYCERESGQEEPERFCARCFMEVHRGDPEMEVHRPQPLSRAGGPVEEGGGGTKSSRAWRRRK